MMSTLLRDRLRVCELGAPTPEERVLVQTKKRNERVLAETVKELTSIRAPISATSHFRSRRSEVATAAQPRLAAQYDGARLRPCIDSSSTHEACIYIHNHTCTHIYASREPFFPIRENVL